VGPGRQELDFADPGENPIGRFPLAEQLAQLGVAQHEGELTEDPQMRGNARADDQEQGVDWLAVDGVELHRPAQQREDHVGLVDV
jgi:hypothetical protein